MKPILVSIVLAATATFGVGCVECTELGCDSGVTVTVTGFSAATQGKLPATVKVCAGAAAGTQCQTFTVNETACTADTTGSECSVEEGSLRAFLYAETEGTFDVTVEVKDAAGAILFDGSVSTEAVDNKPNGDACEPTCHNADAKLTIP